MGVRALQRGCWRRLLIATITIVALGASAVPAMGAIVSGADGTDLTYDAQALETNNLRVTQSGLTVIFDDDVPVTTTNPACAAADGNVTCAAVLPSFITISLLDLNDQTTLTGVSLQSDLAGGPGDDMLRGGDNADTFTSEPGADTYIGGGGLDVLFVTAAAAVTITMDNVANDGTAGEGDNVNADVEDILDFTVLPATLVGSAAANVLQSGDGADTVDGGPGNDMLGGGAGNDTMRARDGFADRIECGEGNDSAVVDTLDVVSGCETIDRADAGNANDVPEDRPPAIAILTPAVNALVAASGAQVTVQAIDDRGVASVQLFDDGAAVGTDGAAPFAIPYLPTGADVGPNTLVAVATDTAGQTATAIRRVRVGRFAPRRVSLTVTPSRDRSFPYRFRASGSVVRPARVSAGQGCREGVVVVTVRRSGRTVSSRRASLRRNCTYTASVSGRAGSNRVTARFLGNAVFAARSSAARPARGG